VVTLSNVTNVPATVVGKQIAQLLNGGFSLSAALAVIGDETVTGRQYVIVGDGNAALTSPRSGGVFQLTIDKLDDGFDVSYYAFPTSRWPLGTTVTPNLGDNTQQYMIGGHITTLSATQNEIYKLFDASTRLPVVVNGSLRWSDDLNLSDEE